MAAERVAIDVRARRWGDGASRNGPSLGIPRTGNGAIDERLSGERRLVESARDVGRAAETVAYTGASRGVRGCRGRDGCARRGRPAPAQPVDRRGRTEGGTGAVERPLGSPGGRVSRLPPPIGERVDVGGFRLHTHRSGSGSPPVVLEPALGAFGYQWVHVMETVAGSTSARAYDRAGQAWSDPSPRPRTPEHLTSELHALLGAVDTETPFVLAAHSFGGLVARAYVARYPDDVAALVLVDASHPDQYDLIPDFARLRVTQDRALAALEAVSRIGPIARAFASRSLAEVRDDMTAEQWDTLVRLAGQPGHHRAVRAELAEFDRWFGPGSEVPTDLGDLPLTVVTAGSSLLGGRAIRGITPEQQNDAHLRLQAEMAESLSTNARQVVVGGASHLGIVGVRRHAAMVAEAILEAARGR